MGPDPRKRRLSGPQVAVLGLVIAAFFALMPGWANKGILSLCTEVLVVFTMAQMWNLLGGYAGLVSIGHQAFVGMGGYFLFGFSDWSGANAYLIIPLAGLWCALVAALVTPLLFRLKEVYFSIGMWVFAEMMRLFHSKIEFIGANHGLPFRAARHLEREWIIPITFWIAAALALGSFTLIFILMRTRFGLGLTAVRDNDLGAENLGVNVRLNRFVAFVISAFGCGCAGALFYMNGFFIEPVAAFNIHWAAAMIFIVIIGGIGTLEGPIIGAVIYYAIREAFPGGGNWYLIVVGVVSVVVMLRAPRGVWGYVQQRFQFQIFPVQRLTPSDFSDSLLPDSLTSWTGWMTPYFDETVTPAGAGAAAASPGATGAQPAAPPGAAPPANAPAAAAGPPEAPGGWIGWMADYLGHEEASPPPSDNAGRGGAEAAPSWMGWMADYLDKPNAEGAAPAAPANPAGQPAPAPPGEPEVPLSWTSWMADYFNPGEKGAGGAPAPSAPAPGGAPEVPLSWTGWMADFFASQGTADAPPASAAPPEPEVPVSWTGWMADYFESQKK